jgi:hypothetical protein
MVCTPLCVKCGTFRLSGWVGWFFHDCNRCGVHFRTVVMSTRLHVSSHVLLLVFSGAGHFLSEWVVAWWGRALICHTHDICVPPLLTSQAWDRTRPVEGFRLYRLGTTWSLKSCFSVLELFPRISVLNYSVSPPDAAALSGQGPPHYRGLMIALFRRVNGLSQRPLPDSTQHSKTKHIHARGGIRLVVDCVMLSALRHGSTSEQFAYMPTTVYRTFLRLSSFRSLYLITFLPPSVVCSLYSRTHVK